MKRYVRFGPSDAVLLAELRPHAEPHLARIADEFYERIREHEEAHAVFTGEEQVERLKKSLVRWMRRVLTGPYDEAYFAETAQIGRVHVRVGLPQRYMLTAMALIRISLGEIAHQAFGGDDAAARAAVAKVLDLELATMLETYREDFVERARRVEQQALNTPMGRAELPHVSAVELAPVMVVGVDADGCVRLFNAEAERVTGLARDEAVGRAFSLLLPADLRDAHESVLLAATRRSGEVETLDGAVRTKSGKVREVRWQLARPPADHEHDVKLYVLSLIHI